MRASPLVKTGLFFLVLLSAITLFSLLVYSNREDLDNRISFVLKDHNNRVVSATDFSGKYLLVFFGFTNCANICPTGMAQVTQIVDKLDKAGLDEKIVPIFISVDPERDSVTAVNDYISLFHHRFIGLTGNHVALKKATESFKTYFKMQNRLSNDENYDVTHSTVIYVVDPFGRLVAHIPHNAAIDTSVDEIKKITGVYR